MSTYDPLWHKAGWGLRRQELVHETAPKRRGTLYCRAGIWGCGEGGLPFMEHLLQTGTGLNTLRFTESI